MQTLADTRTLTAFSLANHKAMLRRSLALCRAERLACRSWGRPGLLPRRLSGLYAHHAKVAALARRAALEAEAATRAPLVRALPSWMLDAGSATPVAVSVAAGATAAASHRHHTEGVT